MLRYNSIHVIAAVLLVTSAAWAAEQKAELNVTADVGISSVVGKMRFSNGVGPTSPIMQNQNWSGFENKNLLMAFDTKQIEGWTVTRAYMTVHMAKGDLYGIGLCTVLGDWVEGRALNWVESPGSADRPGGACWNFARTPAAGAKPTAENNWSWPGSRFDSVSWSHPAARYSNAGPGQITRAKTKDGRFVRLRFPVDPKLVESLAAGVATGLILTDDKGQVRESYSLIGGAKPYRYNAAEDAWIFTREVSIEAYRPMLEVYGEPTDKKPPAAPANLKVAEVSLSDPSVVLTFTAPGDDDATGTVLAYDAAYSTRPITAANWSRAKPLPRWSLPEPVAGGKLQRMPVFTLAPGKYHVAVRGVDEAGNRGPVAGLAVTIASPPDATLAKAPRTTGAARTVPHVAEKGKLSVFAVADMAKVDPVTGRLLRDGSEYDADGAAQVNPIWDGASGTVQLTGAANEVVAFQLILGKLGAGLKDIRVSVGDLAGPDGKKIAGMNAEVFRLWYVSAAPARGRRGSPARAGSWHGDACLPLTKPFAESFDLPAGDNKVPRQKFQSVWVDLYVPRGTAAGTYKGKITVAAAELAAPAEVEVQLNVLPLSLPDELSWILELNRYHSVHSWAGVDARKDPAQALKTHLAYYTIAHKHRCTLNALPVSHSGRVDGYYIPEMQGYRTTNVRVKNWTEYDKRFGPLLDGSAFSAKAGYIGPGAGVPIHHMYTAFHEAWPVWLDAKTYKDWKDVQDRLQFAEFAKKSRRPEVAFTQQYKQGFMRVAKQFFQHFKEKGWTRTSLHFYNNNKYYWKVAFFGGMGRGGVCFWLMDEPTDFDDYDTNAFVMGLAKRAYREAGTPQVKMDGRTDVSQPDMARGLWDDIATVWCIGGLRGFTATAAARERWLPQENHWGYGGGMSSQAAPVQLSQACLLRWAVGYTGYMPWWDSFRGRGGAWQRAAEMTVFFSGQNYAGGGKNYPGPIAGLKMKISRRCQQDIEYLHLLARCKGWDRLRVRRALMPYSDDPTAPLLRFSGLSLDKMDELRRRVVATILAEK